MNCSGNHDWTIQFLGINGMDGPAEFRPMTMVLRFNRADFDYCRATFDASVGQQLKNDTGNYGTPRQKVRIMLDGEPVAMMMVRPNDFTYGDRTTHVEIQDLQKSLDSGMIDLAKRARTIQDVYEEVWENREKKTSLIDEMEFTFAPVEGEDGVIYFNTDEYMGAEFRGPKLEEYIKFATGDYDIDGVSTLKAIWTLNENLGPVSWVDKNGVLKIGSQDADRTQHITAPDDDRVWRHSSTSIRHPREPIRGVAIKGSWVDQPGWNLETDIDQIGSFFNPISSGQEAGDYRIIGLAERTDIDEGKIIQAKNADLKRDGIADAAREALIGEMKKQNTGHVQINPDKSGKHTSFVGLRPGDYLRVVPNDKFFNPPYSRTTGMRGDPPDDDYKPESCGSVPSNQNYLVKSVQHKVHGTGRWSIATDLVMWPFDKVKEIEKSTVYFDPNAESEGEQYLTKGEAHSTLFENE